MTATPDTPATPGVPAATASPKPPPPTGVVTFVFTDIEGSTDLWSKHGAAFKVAKDAHDRIIREACARWAGHEVETAGDSFFILFARASDAIRFAVDAQSALSRHAWPKEMAKQVLVRIGMHTGELLAATEAFYGGPATNLAARVQAAAPGGQVYVSQTARDAARGNLPSEVGFVDAGRHQLKGIDEPQQLFRVSHPSLPRPKGRPGELRPGLLVDDRYEVIRKLGRGGMGTVYLVRHTLLGKELALKVIAPEMQGDETFRSRFIQEANVAMEFVHKHAVPVRSFGVTHDGLCYMTLDYVRGVSLAEVIEREGRLDPARACRIIQMLLEALTEAHGSRIVHRDLKPDNIMIEDRDGADFARILDFGLAKILSDDRSALTAAFTVMGTPAYMSPEQASAQPLDGRSDLYACGVLLYLMLAGRLPFDGATAQQVMNQHVNDPVPPFRASAPDAKIPKDLERVVLRALAKRREERYPTAQALHEALAPFVRSRSARPEQGLGLPSAPAVAPASRGDAGEASRRPGSPGGDDDGGRAGTVSGSGVAAAVAAAEQDGRRRWWVAAGIGLLVALAALLGALADRLLGG